MMAKNKKIVLRSIHRFWGHYFLISTSYGVKCKCGKQKAIPGGGISITEPDGLHQVMTNPDGSFVVKGLGTWTVHVPEDIRRLSERKFRLGQFLGIY